MDGLLDPILGDRDPVDLDEMCRNLAGRKAFCEQRQCDRVHAPEPPPVFGDDHRIEPAVTVSGHGDLDRPSTARQQRLDTGAVPRVSAAGGVVFLVSEVLTHLASEHRLQHRRNELLGQPVRTRQIIATSARCPRWASDRSLILRD